MSALYVVALFALSAIVGAWIMRRAGLPAWEGVTAGLVFGPFGVLLAAWSAHRRSRPAA